MVVRTLLARIRKPQAPLVASGGAAASALRESILDNVRRILSTRRGTLLLRPDFGLPPVGDLVHAFPEATRELERALQQALARYEPRLSRVTVRAQPGEPGDLVLRFEVSATVADGGGALRFETRLSPVRAAEVR